MKILRLIDRYIDSFEKRIFIFIIFITMYWLWQNIWQLLLFYKVYLITDYESLFNLQAHLSNYESSVLIRIIYYVISNPSLNMAGLVSCIKLIDIMGIVGLLILAQKYRIIMILNVFKYVWCTIWIVKGMNSASVYLVINCLKWLSIGGLILVGIVILQWLFGLVRIILEHDRFVHICRQRYTFYKLCTIFYKITQFTTIYIEMLYIKAIKKYLRN